MSSTEATSIPRRKVNKRHYTEDLTCHRIKFTLPQANITPKSATKHKIKKLITPIPTHDITQQLHELLLDLKAYYAMVDSVQGYTIQVYAGGSREQAFQIRNKLHTQYPTFNPEVQYKQPNFTVRIGRFLERLEAYELYIAIKAIMPQAIIRPAYFLNEPDIFNVSSAISTLPSKNSLTQEKDEAHSCSNTVK